MTHRVGVGRDFPVEKLSQNEAEAELKRLAVEIAEHDRRYYQENAPTLCDAEYDALRWRNAAIEARFPCREARAGHCRRCRYPERDAA